MTKTLRLGSIDLANRFVLAPLESVTDSAFRKLCFSNGASFTWTEMLRASSIQKENKATLDLIDTFDSDVPTGVQLLVSSSDELIKCLKKMDELSSSSHPHFKNIKAIDLNLGCPSPSVIRSGTGPSLLKRKSKLRDVFTELRLWQQYTSLPVGFVGAKVRLGLNAKEMKSAVCLPVIELANEHLDYLTVHARHARQESKEAPSWKYFRELKALATVPMIANGDVFSLDDYSRTAEVSGCDGVMIARGAIQSPWCFRQLVGGYTENVAGSGKCVWESVLPSMTELDKAEKEYFELASERKTKEKYIVWHTEAFRRIRSKINDSSR